MMITVCGDESCANNDRKVCILDGVRHIIHGAQGTDWACRECGDYKKRE